VVVTLAEGSNAPALSETIPVKSALPAWAIAKVLGKHRKASRRKQDFLRIINGPHKLNPLRFTKRAVSMAMAAVPDVVYRQVKDDVKELLESIEKLKWRGREQ